MFLEIAWALARPDGQVGMLVPSGIYSDKGASQLRAVFRERSRWTHLYVFQNERFIFPAVDHRFKVAMVAVAKGGATERLLARFRLGPGDSPELEELEDDVPNESRYLPVDAAQIRRFSPNTGAVLEVRNSRDLEILEKLYGNGILLGDRGPRGWGIEYRHRVPHDERLGTLPAAREVGGRRATARTSMATGSRRCGTKAHRPSQLSKGG